MNFSMTDRPKIRPNRVGNGLCGEHHMARTAGRRATEKLSFLFSKKRGEKYVVCGIVECSIGEILYNTLYSIVSLTSRTHVLVSISFELDTAETGKPLVALVALNLFALFGAVPNGVEDGTLALGTEILLGHGFKERKLLQVRSHPIMEILDVSDGIHDASRAQYIGIFSEECGRDNPGLVLACLEMRVGKEKEDGGERVLVKVIREELHGVRADNGDILVRARGAGPGTRARRRGTEGSDAVLDVLGDLDAYFEAWGGMSGGDEEWKRTYRA